jgi:hypothetical protein
LNSCHFSSKDLSHPSIHPSIQPSKGSHPNYLPTIYLPTCLPTYLPTYLLFQVLPACLHLSCVLKFHFISHPEFVISSMMRSHP